MFQVFSAVFLCFSRIFSGGREGQKILGVSGGLPWFLPKHQEMGSSGLASFPERILGYKNFKSLGKDTNN